MPRFSPEVAMAVRWRLVETKRSSGVYFVLEKGRMTSRTQLNLGYVDPDAAQRALRQVQAEEDADSVGRVIRLYERSRDDAVRFLLGDRVADQVLGPPEPDYGAMRLSDYYDTVYAKARAEARPRGWKQEERHWKLLLSKLGHHRLRAIDEFVLADHLDALIVATGKRAGLPVAGNTKRLHRAALQAMFTFAYRKRHVKQVPNLARFRIVGATKSVKVKPDPLTLEEVIALLDATEEPRHRALFAVGAGQGLRPSELVRLEWLDVDWAVPSLRVRGTKTDAAADTIPLTPLAVRELKAWWLVCGQPRDGLMFTTAGGGQYAGAGGYKSALERAAKRAGITRGVYPYLLRDSFATIAWAVGIDRDVARRVLRHTDERMLDRVYCRPRPAELVSKVAAFDL